MSDLTMSSSGLPLKLEGLISIDANLKEVSKTFPDDFKCYPGYPPNFPGQNIVDEQALITLIPEITVGFHVDLTVFGSGGEIRESVTLKGKGWERQFKIRCSQGKVLPEGTVMRIQFGKIIHNKVCLMFLLCSRMQYINLLAIALLITPIFVRVLPSEVRQRDVAYTGYVGEFSGAMVKHGEVNGKVPEYRAEESVFAIHPVIPNSLLRNLNCASSVEWEKAGDLDFAYYYIPNEGLQKGKFGYPPTKIQCRDPNDKLEMLVIPIGCFGTSRWARVSGLVLWLNKAKERAEVMEFSMRIELPNEENEAKARVYWQETAIMDWALAKELVDLRVQQTKKK